jgi:hypothetical protein
MSTCTKSFGVAALALAGLLGGTTAVQAQYPYPANPFLAQQQYFNNAARAMYAPQAYAGNNFAPVYGTGNMYTPAMPGYSPGANVYTPPTMPYYDPYNSYMPYNYDPTGAAAYGGYLRGEADYMRAYGQTVMNIEQARSLRELALQAKYDTKKKAFDTEMYIKANTPTYTEEQAKIAKMTLRRIQSNSTPTEITNGKALNFLLDDLRRYPGKKAALEPFALAEETLKQINVTKSSGNFGLLRDAGKINFPVALLELLSPDVQKQLEGLTESLFKSASKGKLDINALKDLRTALDQIREDLSKKVNEIPTTQYLEAKRFLNDFDEARYALEKGEAGTQFKYREFIAGGKNAQEIVDFLVTNGYKIAPAISGDEAAYRALYSAMAALDVAVNTQYGTPDYKDNGSLPPP